MSAILWIVNLLAFFHENHRLTMYRKGKIVVLSTNIYPQRPDRSLRQSERIIDDFKWINLSHHHQSLKKCSLPSEKLPSERFASFIANAYNNSSKFTCLRDFDYDEHKSTCILLSLLFLLINVNVIRSRLDQGPLLDPMGCGRCSSRRVCIILGSSVGLFMLCSITSVSLMIIIPNLRKVDDFPPSDVQVGRWMFTLNTIYRTIWIYIYIQHEYVLLN